MKVRIEEILGPEEACRRARAGFISRRVFWRGQLFKTPAGARDFGGACGKAEMSRVSKNIERRARLWL